MSAFKTLKLGNADPIATLRKHRTEYDKSGVYPFLIADETDLDRVLGPIKHADESPQEIIEKVSSISFQEILAERRARCAESYEISELVGVWPKDSTEFSSHRDFPKKSLQEKSLLGLIELKEAWHFPAAMHFGGWNECPYPIDHCVFFEYWQKRFGAEIVAISGDTLECLVSRPPRTRHEAMDLAWQQFFFCEDNVLQGTLSVSALAAVLLDNEHWFFWWD